MKLRVMNVRRTRHRDGVGEEDARCLFWPKIKHLLNVCRFQGEKQSWDSKVNKLSYLERGAVSQETKAVEK